MSDLPYCNPAFVNKLSSYLPDGMEADSEVMSDIPEYHAASYLNPRPNTPQTHSCLSTSRIYQDMPEIQAHSRAYPKHRLKSGERKKGRREEEEMKE